jgi:hypothetical protein
MASGGGEGRSGSSGGGDTSLGSLLDSSTIVIIIVFPVMLMLLTLCGCKFSQQKEYMKVARAMKSPPHLCVNNKEITPFKESLLIPFESLQEESLNSSYDSDSHKANLEVSFPSPLYGSKTDISDDWNLDNFPRKNLQILAMEETSVNCLLGTISEEPKELDADRSEIIPKENDDDDYDDNDDDGALFDIISSISSDHSKSKQDEELIDLFGRALVIDIEISREINGGFQDEDQFCTRGHSHSSWSSSSESVSEGHIRASVIIENNIYDNDEDYVLSEDSSLEQ